jgi:hypothetical protein
MKLKPAADIMFAAGLSFMLKTAADIMLERGMWRLY